MSVSHPGAHSWTKTPFFEGEIGIFDTPKGIILGMGCMPPELHINFITEFVGKGKS
jgi:hypothetical protein